MPAERHPGDLAIHASAVAIGGRALLIRGPSRSGKSRLAAALVNASARRRPIVLVGDDRILLRATDAGLFARPHPRIAGFIERRGLGIVSVPFAEMAPVAAVVELGPCDHVPENFPTFQIVMADEVDTTRDQVLDWWDASATCASHPARKAAARLGRPQKIRIGKKTG